MVDVLVQALQLQLIFSVAFFAHTCKALYSDSTAIQRYKTRYCHYNTPLLQFIGSQIFGDSPKFGYIVYLFVTVNLCSLKLPATSKKSSITQYCSWILSIQHYYRLEAQILWFSFVSNKERLYFYYAIQKLISLLLISQVITSTEFL